MKTALLLLASALPAAAHTGHGSFHHEALGFAALAVIACLFLARRA